MKSILVAILASLALVACGKKEEVKPVEPESAVTVTPVPSPAPVASEPAKVEEAKK